MHSPIAAKWTRLKGPRSSSHRTSLHGLRLRSRLLLDELHVKAQCQKVARPSQVTIHMTEMLPIISPTFWQSRYCRHEYVLSRWKDKPPPVFARRALFRLATQASGLAAFLSPVMMACGRLAETNSCAGWTMQRMEPPRLQD